MAKPLQLEALAPRDAIAWFQRKGYAATFDYKDLWQASRENAFAISGVTSMDLLHDIHDEIERALEQGLAFEEFKDRAEKIIAYHGWYGETPVTDPITGKTRNVKIAEAPRLQNIYRTNIASALNQGRAIQMSQQAAFNEAHGEESFGTFRAVRDNRTTPICRSLDGLTRPWNDPIWKVIMPPLNYQCRSGVHLLTRRDLDDRDIEVSPKRTLEMRRYHNDRTGQVVEAPVGVQPGFGRSDWQQQVRAELEAYLQKAPASVRAFAERRLKELREGTREIHADELHPRGADGRFIKRPAIAAHAEVRKVARVIIFEPVRSPHVKDMEVWLFDPADEPYIMFPGGGVEPNESFEDAAVREAEEETGLDIEIVRWLAEFTDEYSQRQYYLARKIGGAPTSIDEDGDRLVRVYRVAAGDAMGMLTSQFDRDALAMVLDREEFQIHGKEAE